MREKWRMSTCAQVTHGARLMLTVSPESRWYRLRALMARERRMDRHPEREWGSTEGRGGRPARSLPGSLGVSARRSEAVEHALDERPEAGTRRSQEAEPRDGGAPSGPAGRVIAPSPCPRPGYLLCPAAQLLQPAGGGGWKPAAPSLEDAMPGGKGIIQGPGHCVSHTLGTTSPLTMSLPPGLTGSQPRNGPSLLPGQGPAR